MTEQIVGKPPSRLAEDPYQAYDNCLRYAVDEACDGNVWGTYQGFSEANRILVTEGIKDSLAAIGRLDGIEFVRTLAFFVADSATALLQEHLVVTFAATQYVAQKFNRAD